MESVINAVIKEVLLLFTNGFIAGVQESEFWLFSRLDQLLLRGTGSPLSSGWFYHFFQKMELISLALVLPLFLVAVLGSVFMGSGAYLSRLVCIYLPFSLVGSGLLLFVYQSLAAAVNSMSGWLVASEHLSLGSLVSMTSWLSMKNAANPVPFLILALAGIASLFGALSLYFELLLRQGVMLLLGAFIPFAVIFVLLTSSKTVLYRYLEVAVGVLLSKLFVVVLLCLGAELVAHSGGSTSIGQFMTGVAMLVLSAFSPFVLFSLIPIAHIDHQGQVSQSSRRHLAGLARKTGVILGGPASQPTGEIPLAGATSVPSYLKSGQ